jgi:hypothetical protein
MTALGASIYVGFFAIAALLLIVNPDRDGGFNRQGK